MLYAYLLQILVGRLQKERDEAKSECKDLHDRLEIQHSQLLKTQREKEILHTELEVYKERLDKLQSSVQKIHVSFLRKDMFRRNFEIFLIIMFIFWKCKISGRKRRCQGKIRRVSSVIEKSNRGKRKR